MFGKREKPPLYRMDESADALLLRAGVETDPRTRYALLSRAETLEPDSFKVQCALLKHGRLHERDAKRIDFSIIPCALLRFLDEPKEYDERAARACVDELFSGERLHRCMALAPDADAFFLEYLGFMADEYIRIFIMGATKYARGLFGFTIASRQPMYMADPVARMIGRALESPCLTADQAVLIARALRDAFIHNLRDPSWLDVQLGADTLKRIEAPAS